MQLLAQMGQGMSGNSPMMPMMGGGMFVFGLLYILALILFFWLFYRLVRAVETMAEQRGSGDESYSNPE